MERLKIKKISVAEKKHVSSIENRKYANRFAHVIFNTGKEDDIDCRDYPEWNFAHKDDVVFSENGKYALVLNQDDEEVKDFRTAVKMSKPNAGERLTVSKIISCSETVEHNKANKAHQIAYVLLNDRYAQRVDLTSKPRKLRIGSYFG